MTSSGSGNISYQPTDGLCYDPTDDRYWDPQGLQKEIKRAFEICHGCRMCFKYCDSFPKLFSALDDNHDGDVHKVTADETREIMDACFQCKLCEVQCPYTPRDKHEFQLDFPKLVHRYAAHRARRAGLTVQQSVLGDPDGTATFARASLGLANVMNRNQTHRWFLEKVLGIHRDKQLPEFAGETFEKWAKKEGRIKPVPEAHAKEEPPEVVLFQTCYIQNNEPEIGRDTLKVLDNNDVNVACAEGLVCCGMPAWEHGDLETVQANGARNLDILMPYVEAGAKVVAINPSCSMMLRREYPELLDGPDRARAEKVAEAIRDSGEFLWSIRKEPRFNTDFKSTPNGPVAYHAPCHLRAQAIGFKGRDLLRKIPNVQPKMTMECCGHDGTYAMRVDGFEPSARIGRKAFEGVKEADAEIWATDCPLAAIQFEQHADKKPMHPMSILARAYEADGFATSIAPEPEDEE